MYYGSMSERITPNFREILAAQSTVTGDSEYLLSTNGFLNVNATATIAPGSEVTITQGGNDAIVDALGRLSVKINNNQDGSVIGKVLLSNNNNNAVQDINSTTSEAFVGGGIASGATDAGFPVKVGGKYNSSPITLTNGQRGDMQLDVNGYHLIAPGTAAGSAATTALQVGMMGSAGMIQLRSAGNLTTNTTGNGSLSTVNYMYNGTSYDAAKTIIHGMNTTTGVPAAGLVAELDDASTTSVTENQFAPVRLSADRSLLVTPRATTPTQTSVAASASSVSLLAANLGRKGAIVTNDSSAILYLKLGTTASTTSYTVTLAGAAAAPFTYYEVPFGYTGAIDGIWASATGNSRITELA